VDIAFEALETASRYFNSRLVCFVQADAIALPFQDDSFDVVTSFETLEHIYDHRSFIKEIRRVLREGGHLILSTPNASITSRYPRNPFHVHEFTARELYELLAPDYQRVELRGQLLKPSYRIAPFLPGREVPEAPVDYVWLLVWKLANRLPYKVKDALAMALLGRHFYPSEADYVFDREAIEMAHVLVAICTA
jgi:SAM-dependent methyltransferase